MIKREELAQRAGVFFDTHPELVQIIEAIVGAGGRPLLVGGVVRDLFLERAPGDIDVEVYGLCTQGLETVLSSFGPVSLVGKSFGVLRLHGLDVDWSLPRTDSSGRHPDVMLNPKLSFKEAFRRRDLTINAMGIDCQSYELIDEYGGYNDLEAGLLRAVDPDFFVEDPLRFFRVMQFLGRLNFKTDKMLDKVCAGMDVSGVACERIEQELEKLMLYSSRPSLGWRWVRQIGRLKELFPELFALTKTEQDPEWHPEGDVFEHSMQAIDVATSLKFGDSARKLAVMYGVLCHDLGKPATTKIIEGRIHSRGHSEAGQKIARTFLRRFTRKKWLIDAVVKLVRYHMEPIIFVDASDAAFRRLAYKCAPDTNLFELALVSRADRSGRNKVGGKQLQKNVLQVDAFIERAKRLEVLYTIVRPLLLGKDLMGQVQPGPEMGAVLRRAYQMQIEHGIQDRDELLKRALQWYRQHAADA
ncbi:HD domain-containing protein [bacterium]|jgi:tRNA nucleotidyltransferase (CCA-adding enzyme)|nr:HD domain-containing protein [bacterium]MBT4578210.1 HD domain-containing protein [bacterium]MBT5345445.1 HD domain-containing protein [bacterium]MBT6131139.1 HD domain-containing protein [bacterium]